MAVDQVSASAIALAGRRIDPNDTENVRFPLKSAAAVGAELERALRRANAGYLVCSAACGADLLALQAAVAIGVPYRIILPFDRARFRAVSVTDRPGNWGDLFDRMVDAAAARNALVVLGGKADDTDAFTEANKRIIGEVQISSLPRKVAIAVWEGSSRGVDDATAELLSEATCLGFETVTVLTTMCETS